MTDPSLTRTSLLGSKLKKLTAIIVSTVAFLGAVTSLFLNAGRLNDRNAVKDEPTVQLILTVAEEQPIPNEHMSAFDQYDVHYEAEDAASGLTLTYSSDYFEPDAKEVGLLSEGPYFALPKVGLDLKLVNNTDEVIFLTEAIIDVKDSRPDNRPLLAFTHNVGNVGEIEFSSDGWGEPSLLNVMANIEHPQSHEMSLPMRKTESFVPNAPRYLFDILPLLEPFGISSEDYKTARALSENEGDVDYREIHQAWAKVHVPCMHAFATRQMLADTYSMIYGQDPAPGPITLTDEDLAKSPYGCDAPIKGNLIMTWNGEAGEQSQTIRFDTRVSITPPDGLGAAGFEPTGAYDVEFRHTGANYMLRVPLSQPIGPKAFDRFFLWMGAPQSSNHEFTVRLQYNEDKELVSKPVKLTYIRPRYNTIMD